MSRYMAINPTKIDGTIKIYTIVDNINDYIELDKTKIYSCLVNKTIGTNLIIKATLTDGAGEGEDIRNSDTTCKFSILGKDKLNLLITNIIGAVIINIQEL